ncbi:MAG: hypothetical protein ACRDOD_13175 [Streptosporangiaceae bacterium]
MALAGALCNTLLAATGITNKSLRALMTGLLHAPYSPGQMTYDLRRLRPLLAASRPQAPPELRQALRIIEQHVDACITSARLGKIRVKT